VATGITVWPFEPNSDEALQEEYGYQTNIITAYGGMEQRIALRQHPTGAVEFAFRLADNWEAQRANALLYRKHAKLWAVPLWHYGTKLTADALVGATELFAVTANVPFTDPLQLGQYALLWKSARSFELVELFGVHASSLDLSKLLSATWAAGTWLLPVRLARLGNIYAVSWENSLAVAGRIRFDFEAWATGVLVPTVGDQTIEGVQPAFEA
jgi:hypothetical protein